MSSVKNRPRLLIVNRSFIIHKGKILLIQRAKIDTYKPGQWEVPGGKLEKGEDIATALEKEALEETNLAIQPIDRLAFYNSGVLSTGKYKGLTFIQLFGVSQVIAGKIRLSHEHDSYKWVTLKELEKEKITDETRKAFVHLEKKLKTLVKKY